MALARKNKKKNVAALKWSTLLPYIVTWVTGRERYRPVNVEWSRDLFVHNIFRAWELVFWRAFGPNGAGDTIRKEASASIHFDEAGNAHVYREFYSAEALFAHFEGIVREQLKNVGASLKGEELPFLYIPRPVFGGLTLVVLGIEMHFTNGSMIAPLLAGSLAYDNSGQANGSGTSTTTISLTTSGSNRFLATGATEQSNGSTISSATYASANLTEIDHGYYNAIPGMLCYAHYLIAPATGSNTLSITWSGGSAGGVVVSSYTGAYQTSQPDAYSKTQQGSSATLSTSVTVVASNCWMIGVVQGYNCAFGNGTITVSGVLSSIRQGVDDKTAIADSNGAVGTGSRTATWSQSGSANLQMQIAFSIAPVAATTYYQTITATGTGTAVLSKSIAYVRTLTVTATGTASFTRTVAYIRTLVATATGTAVYSRIVAYIRTLVATATGTATATIFKPIEILINGVDYSGEIDWSSFRKTEVLTYQPDSCSFLIRNVAGKTYRPSLNDDVKVYRDGVLIFGGVVISTAETMQGLVRYFSVQCKDYTEALDGVLVAKSYASMTAAAIISDLITNFAPAGFTVTNVVAPDTVNAIKFNYVSLSQCLQNLANALPGYDWYVDYNKDIHFFQSATISAPFKLGESGLDLDNFIYGSLEYDADQSQIRNTIVVRGGTVVGSTINNEQVSDGTQVVYYVGYNLDTTSFTASHALAASPTSFTALTVGRDGIDDPASYDCLYNPTLGLIRFVTAYPAGDVVKTSGTPSYPLVSISSDQVSVGTYGTKEFLIQDQNITTKQQALDRAAAMLAKYSQPIYSGQFTTLKAGLVQGQTIQINLPSRNISGFFKIQQIETTLRTPSGGSADLVFVVSFVSSFNIGIIEILNRLLIQDQANMVPIAANEIPNRIYGPLETILFNESFTASKGQAAGTETVTFTEGFVEAKNAGTIFVAGPYVPTGVYRIFVTGGAILG